MFRGALLLLGISLSFPAHAELNSVMQVLAPAFFGVTNRRTDDGYARLLKIDRRATVHLSLWGGRGACTGRLLNPTTLLTAAHCVNRDTPGGDVNIEGVTSVNFFIAPETPKGSGEIGQKADIKYDLAIVVFPEGTGEFLGIESYAGVVAKSTADKEAWLVGYGDARPFMDPSLGGAGVKGWGKLGLGKVEDGVIYTTSGNVAAETRKEGEKAGERVAALMGDSGGSVHNKSGEIIGVVSGMEPDMKTLVIDIDENMQVVDAERVGYLNYLVDAASEQSRNVYKMAVQCDTKPCAGNFVGSGIPADENYPVLTKSREHSNEDLFSHLTLRTGRYKHVKGKKPDVFVTSQYNGNAVVGLWVRTAAKDHETSGFTMYGCDGENCAGGILGMNVLTINEGNEFSIKHAFGNSVDEYVLSVE